MMFTKRRLRTMVAADSLEIAQLEKLCMHLPWSQKLIEESVAGIPHKRYWCSVLEIDQAILAYCIALIGVDNYELLRIATYPRVQRKGYSRELLQDLERNAAVDGKTSIWLEVASSNTNALYFYEQLGFKKQALRKNYYYNRQTSEWEAAINMSKDISSLST